MQQIAYSYTRLSSAKQLAGHGATRQRETIEKLCEARGWTLSDKSYDDLGISAYHAKNRTQGALGLFIEAVEQGVIASGSILVVESIDRLSREEVDRSLRLMLTLLDLGILIFTVSDQKLYRSGSPNAMLDIMTWLIVASRANEESVVKSKRIRDAKARHKAQARETGRIITRQCPKWLKVNHDKTQFIVDTAMAQTIKSIFRWYSEGLSLRSICDKLNAHGATWKPATITSLLVNRKVLGEFQPLVYGEDGKSNPDGDVVCDYYPRIIEDDLFTRCKLLRDTRKAQGRKSSEPYANLFKGLLRCTECGSGIGLSTDRNGGRVYKNLRCANRSATKCSAPRWKYDVVETMIVVALQNLPWDTGSHSASEALCASLRDSIDLLDAEYQGCTEKTENALEALIALPTNKMLQAKAETLDNQVQALSERLAKLRDDLEQAERVRLVETLDHVDVNLVLDSLYSDDEESRPRVNLMLHKQVSVISLTSLKDDPKLHGRIDIELTSGHTAGIEVWKGYSGYSVTLSDGTQYWSEIKHI
ncbi:recombinase family protein [Vibrio breoganii]